MRITIWLSIVVFVTSLFWPHLFNASGLLYCALSLFLLLCCSQWRYLAIVPLTLIYFNGYTYLQLLGVSSDFAESAYNTQDSSVKESSLGNFYQQRVSFLSNTVSEQDNTITIEVKSLINTKNNGYFLANVISIDNKPCLLCPLIEMRWFAPSFSVQAGQIHQFKVRIKALQGKGNPASFDRQKWRYSEHVAYIASIKEHLQTINSAISLRAYLYQKALLATESLSHQGAILALIFADKNLMTLQEKESIKKLGIAHLFAISGLHIGLMFAFAFVLASYFVKRFAPISLLGWRSWVIINTLAFSVCLFYGYISGFSLPTQRALLMLLVSLVVLSSKRKISLFDLLVLCFWGILVIDPLSILSSSLWLSFTAMSAILFFIWMMPRGDNNKLVVASYWQKWFQPFFTFVKWLFLLQLVLTLFMLPIQLTNFSAVSLFSLVINMIAIPLFSWVIIPLTLIGSVLLLLSTSLSSFLFSIADRLLHYFLYYSEFFLVGYLPLSDIKIMLILSVFLAILLMLMVSSLTRFFVFNKVIPRALIVFFMAFVVIRMFELGWKEKHAWQVEVFDIGQGLAVLIRSHGQTLLYDTGPSYPPYYAAADSDILPYLQARGIKQLDYLMVSHSDNDHAGGAMTVLNSIKVLNAYAGEATLMNQRLSGKKFNATPKPFYQQCTTGQTLSLGKLTLTVLSPKQVEANNNNNSCVVKVSDGINSLLLTGDIKKEVEQMLINTIGRQVLKSDILMAAHHGSNTSSSSAFIKAVDPRWVVFSAGYKNRWHFPTSKVSKRYQAHGVKQITTGNSGFIRFNVENQHIEVKTFREDLAPYWYHRHLVF